MCYSFCGVTNNSVSSTAENVQPGGAIQCVDKNAFCSAKFCSSWSKAQTDCMKTCNPACQPKPKPTKPPRVTTPRTPRPTRPQRIKPTKPPKYNKAVMASSPCQDNAQYAAYCRGAFMQCSSMIGKMYCMRTCGMCAKIDRMFICKDDYPDLCPTAYCGNVLTQQYCKKSCNKCLKPQAFARQMQNHNRQQGLQNQLQQANRNPQTTRRPQTTRKTQTTRKIQTTRKSQTTRRPAPTRRTMATRPPAQVSTLPPATGCFDNRNYAHICQSTTIDCSSAIIAAECRQTCGFCNRSRCEDGFEEKNYECVDEDECLKDPCQVCYSRLALLFYSALGDRRMR